MSRETVNSALLSNGITIRAAHRLSPPTLLAAGLRYRIPDYFLRLYLETITMKLVRYVTIDRECGITTCDTRFQDLEISFLSCALTRYLDF